MLYSKDGSIPKPETDGTEGWVEVPDAPECPAGKEVVWLNWQWIVRDPKPTDRPGYQWNWIHDQMSWVEYQTAQEAALTSEPLPAITSDEIPSLSSQQISAFE